MPKTNHFMHGDTAVRKVMERRRDKSLLGLAVPQRENARTPEKESTLPALTHVSSTDRRVTYPDQTLLTDSPQLPTLTRGSPKKVGATREVSVSPPTVVAGPSPHITSEVKDALATSITALRRWTLLHHPAASVAFARKIITFCEEACRSAEYLKKSVRKSLPTNQKDDTLQDKARGPQNTGLGIGALMLNDSPTNEVNEQGFAIALTPLYHIPAPSIVLKTVRVPLEAFSSRLTNESQCEGNLLIWTVGKRKALLDLIRTLRSITSIELESGGVVVGSLGNDNSEQLESHFGGLDTEFLSSQLLPLLAENRKLAKKMTKRHLTDAKRATKLEEAEEIKMLTAGLVALCSEEYKSIVAEEAKARHKLAAACQFHKTAKRKAQQRRMLVDRFIVEQKHLKKQESEAREFIAWDEMSAVRKLLWFACWGAIDSVLVLQETRERKCIRDFYYLEGYEIRKHLNDVFERKRADRDELDGFEQKMRQLMLADESMRFDTILSTHVSTMKNLRLHSFATVRHLERMQAIASGSFEPPVSIVSTNASPRDEDSRRSLRSGSRTPVSARSRSTAGSS